MIVNHKYKFIFLKTRKTASTSIEIALSQLCGSRDVITPISREDEALRASLGYPGPQNYILPLTSYKRQDWLSMLVNRRRKKFDRHIGALEAKEILGSDIWDNYYKFCFERNPFDKAISRYFYSTSEPRPSIEEYVNVAPVRYLSNWNCYTINDHLALDHIGRYESLVGEIAMLSDKLGLPVEMRLPNAKGKYRINREDYKTLLGEKARRRIELICGREIQTFGYSW